MTSPGGFSLDTAGASRVVSDLGAVAEGYSAVFTDFGGTSAAGLGPQVWGSSDANDVDLEARDVSDRWEAFAEAWGQFVDEGVGAVTKVREAVVSSVGDYRSGDVSAASSIAGVLGGRDTFDLSAHGELVAPDESATGGSAAERWAALDLTSDPARGPR